MLLCTCSHPWPRNIRGRLMHAGEGQPSSVALAKERGEREGACSCKHGAGFVPFCGHSAKHRVVVRPMASGSHGRPLSLAERKKERSMLMSMSVCVLQEEPSARGHTTQFNHLVRKT